MDYRDWVGVGGVMAKVLPKLLACVTGWDGVSIC